MDDFVVLGAVLGVVAALAVLACVYIVSGRIEATSQSDDG